MSSLIRGSILAVAAVCLSLSGCSADDAAETPPASPTVETSPEVLPPVFIDGPTPVEAAVGDTLVVTSQGVVGVTTDNAEVLRVSQPTSDGSAEFNAGAEAIAAGTAILTVQGENADLYEVEVTVSER